MLLVQCLDSSYPLTPIDDRDLRIYRIRLSVLISSYFPIPSPLFSIPSLA
jgi:hypothetical protein